jgi:urea transport system permease protein
MHGMYLMRMIGDRGQHHKPIPDFLVFLGWAELPAFWKPFANFPFALTMVFLLPALISYIFGYLAFRSRIKGVYFSILTQALTYGASLMFFRNNLLMGGNNGFTDFKFVLGYAVNSPGTKRGLYIATAVMLLLVYLGCRWLSRTKFGLVQQAIRDGENRVLFSGYATANYKLFVFVLAALIAAVGGALYVPQVGIINPSEMTPDKSLEAVVWCAVGGRGTLVGPILGAISINALKSYATRAFPDLWLIILGGLFILVVLFLPGGLVSIPARLKALWKKFGAAAPPADITPATAPEILNQKS